MEKAFNNLLKYIDKLPHTKKEQVYQWVKRYVDPTSSASERLINEMREARFKGVATKYLDNYLAWFLFVDNRSNEGTRQHIKELLVTLFVFEMTDTYDSLRLSKFKV